MKVMATARAITIRTATKFGDESGKQAEKETNGKKTARGPQSRGLTFGASATAVR